MKAEVVNVHCYFTRICEAICYVKYNNKKQKINQSSNSKCSGSPKSPQELKRCFKTPERAPRNPIVTGVRLNEKPKALWG